MRQRKSKKGEVKSRKVPGTDSIRVKLKYEDAVVELWCGYKRGCREGVDKERKS